MTKIKKPTKSAKITKAANELTEEELVKVSGGDFISFGDIKGESTDDKHKDWIEVLSVKHR